MLGSFDVGKWGPVSLRSIEKIFMFVRQTKPFLKRFCERNICEGLRDNRCDEGGKLRPKRREVLMMMQMKPQDHPFQRAEPIEYSKKCRNPLDTL